MEWLELVLVGMLLPVFPASVVFNAVIRWTPTGWGKAAAMILLPEVGVALLPSISSARVPLVHSRGWIVLVAFSALLYAFRAISVREISIWARLMATSGLGLVWIFEATHRGRDVMAVAVLAWSVPAALLLVLAGLLTERSGGAYLGLQGGLARVVPRISSLATLSALALVATPLFPSFFALLHVIGVLRLFWLWPLLLVLLVWGWSLGGFLQQLLFGSYSGERFPDLGTLATSSGAVVLSLLVVSAVVWSGAWIGI